MSANGCIDNHQPEQNKKSANIDMSFYPDTLEVEKRLLTFWRKNSEKQYILQKDREMNGQQSPTEITADSVECLSEQWRC
jgi:hypothetical protein